MISKVEIHQRFKAGWPYLVLAAFSFSPLYSTVIFTVIFIAKAYTKIYTKLKIFGFIALFIDIIAILINVKNGFLFSVHYSIQEWLFGISAIRLLIPIITSLIFLLLGNTTSDQLLVQMKQKKRNEKVERTNTIPFEVRRHLFVAGTTGSGKTTWLLQYIQDSIIAGEPLYIISGKNGTDDPRSLLSVTKALAKKYSRKLMLVSLNQREHQRECYNPLSVMSPTELADALVMISDYTEPHYKACTAVWIKSICECLALAGIPYSLNSVTDFFAFDDFRELLTRLASAGKLAKNQLKNYLTLKQIAQEASLSRSRYLNLLHGDGADLFGDGESFVNASIAKQENAIFFLDLDSFRYTDYTRDIGKLFISDIRHIISTETEMGTKKRVIMDELGSFATEQLLPLFSQARSYGYQIIVATQSIADLDAISETFTERILENCGQYAVMQLNSDKDAERIADIIGCYDSVETTWKSSGQLLDPSGAGTKRLVNEYKVTPDYIKELQPLNAVYYDKRHPNVINLIKVPFIKS